MGQEQYVRGTMRVGESAQSVMQVRGCSQGYESEGEWLMRSECREAGSLCDKKHLAQQLAIFPSSFPIGLGKPAGKIASGNRDCGLHVNWL